MPPQINFNFSQKTKPLATNLPHGASIRLEVASMAFAWQTIAILMASAGFVWQTIIIYWASTMLAWQTTAIRVAAKDIDGESFRFDQEKMEVGGCD